MRRRVAVIGAAAVLLSAAASGIALIEFGKRIYFSPGPLLSAAFFEIPRGAGAARVAADLEEGGFIDAPGSIPAALLFREGAKRAGVAQSIRYGTFEFPAGASMDRILEIITDPEAARPRFRVQLRAGSDGGRIVVGERSPGGADYAEIMNVEARGALPPEYGAIADSQTSVGFRVSVPEGLTSWQIVESLNSAPFLSGETGGIPSEGSLAPDTYSVSNGEKRAALLARMQAAQEKILAAEWNRKSEDLPVKTMSEALVLASIVEKETGLAAERRLVASVLVNRLRNGMPLQTDPTVIYGVTEGKAPLGRGLRQSELKKDTPYNTYLHAGLPPTPIANPGKPSIRAALNPDQSDYLYFVADGTGGHAFAVTYRDHRRNVREWRKIEDRAASGN